jgi:hypothetical protein
MASELPYFRFTASEWLNDDISLESYHHKGTFIDICAYYWTQDCNVTLEKLQKKFANCDSIILDLIKLDIIKHEKRHDKLEIVFLNKQYDLLSEKRKTNRINGFKGSEAKARLKRNVSYKDNNKDNNKDKDKIYKFNFKYSLISLGANEILVDEWLIIRKKKKSVNTETALKGFISEQVKSNKGLDEIIKMCVEKSWAGFEASWIQPIQLGNDSTMAERAAKLSNSIINTDWAKDE